MNSGSIQMESDFEDAQTGKGTRKLSVGEALKFLEFCTAKGWAFQSMEASELKLGLEYPDFRYVILGLTKAEKTASSPQELYNIAKSTLQRAAKETNPFVFQVWIDKVENILQRTR